MPGAFVSRSGAIFPDLKGEKNKTISLKTQINLFAHWDFLVSSHIVSLRDERHGAGSSQIALDDLHLVVFANELDIEGSWSHPAAWMTG